MGPDSPLRFFHLCALTALTFGCAATAVRRLAPSPTPAERAGRIWLLAVAQIILLQLALGIAGWLKLWPLTAATCALALAALVGGRGRRPVEPPPPTDLAGPGNAPAAISAAPPAAAPPPWSELVSWLVLCAPLGYLLFWVYQFRWTPPAATDALHYHMPAVANWLHSGSIFRDFVGGEDHGLVPYMPFYVELVFHWLTAPLGSDFLARFGQAPFLFFAGLALFNILRSLGATAASARYAVAFLMIARPVLPVPLVLTNVDLATCSFALAGVDELLRLRRDRTLAGAVVMSIAFGLYFGSKHIAAVSMPVIAVALALGCPPRVGGLPRRVVAPLCLLLIALVGGYIYGENLIRTGSPLFPANVRIGGRLLFHGLYDVGQEAKSWLEWNGFRDLISPEEIMAWSPPTAAALGFCMLLGMAGLLRRGGGDGGGRGAVFAFLLVLPGVLLLAIYRLILDPQARYFMLPSALLVGWVAFALDALRRRPVLQAAVGCALVLLRFVDSGEDECALIEWSGPAFAVSLALAAVAGAVATVAPRLAGLRAGALRIAPRAVWGSAGLVAAAAAVALGWGPALRFYPGGWPWIASLHSPSTDTVGMLGMLCQLTEERPATVSYVGDPLIYPYFGPHLANRVVYTHIQPDCHRWLHEYPRIEFPPLPQHTGTTVQVLYRSRPDREAWLRGLRANRVDYLALWLLDEDAQINPRAELEWALADPWQFECLFRSERAYLFRFRRAP